MRGQQIYDLRLILDQEDGPYIENSNVVAKKIKDKLTAIDVDGNGYISASSSSTPIGLEQM